MTDVSKGGVLSFEPRVCPVEGCSRRGGSLFSNNCAYHDSLSMARELSPEDFDALRSEMATTAPLSDEAKRQRRVRSALKGIEWKARDLKSEKRRARTAGATEGQISDAVTRGKASAR
jgi:hypothetical protein